MKNQQKYISYVATIHTRIRRQGRGHDALGGGKQYKYECIWQKSAKLKGGKLVNELKGGKSQVPHPLYETVSQHTHSPRGIDFLIH